MKLKDKKALVTGSSRGIGRAVAHILAREGARIAIHYTSDESVAQKTLASLPGGPHVLIKGDISHPREAERIVREATTQLNGLDVLVNNAGVYDLHPLDSLTYADWQAYWNRIIGINLLGAANVSFCAIEEMKKRGGGRIVNVSSRGAFRGEPDAPAYGASKAGMNAMGQSLAKALVSKNIFVYTVAPGFVQTDRVAPVLTGERGEEIRRQSPFGRVAQPEEVAQAVLFLASEAPEFMTGCIVDINGASYLRT